MADISPVARKGAMLALCSCERTFSPDEATIARGLKAAGQEPGIIACSQLCGADRDLLGKLAGASSVTIACEQEQAALRTALQETGFTGEARFVDIRDRAVGRARALRPGRKWRRCSPPRNCLRQRFRFSRWKARA